MSEIAINYTSRDYAALKQELINLVSLNTGKSWDPTDNSDLGNVLLESFAYMGDIMGYYIDRAANETSVDTAVKTDTLLGFASLFGYKPSGPTPAQVTVQFTNNNSTSVDLPIGTQVMAPLTYGPFAQCYFETTQAYVAVQTGQSVSITAIEGKTVNTDKPDYIDPVYHKPLPAIIGTSDGTPSQNITILDLGIVDNSLIVYVGQGVSFSPWTYVSTLIEYGPEDLVFTTSQNSDGTLTVIFGDGVNGSIPPASQVISAIYKTSVGIYGNIISNAIAEVSFIPGNVDPDAITYFTATNPSPAVGGADADNTSQIRSKIKGAIATRRRAVTLADYNYLTALVPLVGRANSSAGVYTSVNVYVQSQYDGSATPGLVSGVPTPNWTALQNSVASYLSDKTPVGTTVNVLPPSYIPVYINIAVVAEPALKQSTLKLAVYKALLASGTGLFSYDQVSFGMTVPLSALYAAVSNVTGVASANVVQLCTDNSNTASTLVFSPNQIPYLLPANLTITVSGGIAL